MKKLMQIQDISQDLLKKISNKFWMRSLVSGAAIAMLGTVTLPVVNGKDQAIAQQNNQQIAQKDQSQQRSNSAQVPQMQLMQVGDLNRVRPPLDNPLRCKDSGFL